VGLLGNLVPLSENQNKSLQDQAWTEKRKRFRGSNFKTTQALAKSAAWLPDEVDHRTSQMIAWIQQRWPELSSI
jgi:hypothetical protein